MRKIIIIIAVVILFLVSLMVISKGYLGFCPKYINTMPSVVGSQSETNTTSLKKTLQGFVCPFSKRTY